MAIETPQHYIPDITMQREIAVNATQQYIVEVNTTTTANITKTLIGVQGQELPFNVELLIVALVIVALAVLLLALGAQRIEEYRRAEARGRPEGLHELRLRYRYEGLKLQLRLTYARLLSRASSRGVRLPRGYTVSEVSERLKPVMGGWVSWFAEVYNKYMYGVEEPPYMVVEEAKRRVGFEGD